MYDKKTNRSRGFGFVTFETEEGVQAVLSSEHEIMGKWVEIKRAEPRDMSRNNMDHMGGYSSYRPDGGRGPMRGGMRGGMGGRGGYDDFSGYSPYMGMSGRGGGYGYGYGAEGGYGGGSMSGRGVGQGYPGYGYGGSSMPPGGYYGQPSGGTGGYAGYGNAAAASPLGGGYRGDGYGTGGRSAGVGGLGSVGVDRNPSIENRSSLYGYGAGRGGGQGASWTGSGYGGVDSSRQEAGAYPDYRAQMGSSAGRQDRQYRPY